MIEAKLLHTFSGHQNPVYTVINSQKEHIFFTAGNDKGVVEWSLKKMDFVKVMMPVQSSVYAMLCPRDTSIMVVGERSGKISIFDFVQQKVVAVLAHHKLPVFSLNACKSKNELISCSEDGTVSIWDLNSEKYSLLYSFKLSDDTIRVSAINPEETQIAFGCKDGNIYIYNLVDYSLETVLNGHTMPVTSLAFAPDGKYLLSGGRDARLLKWNVNNFSIEEDVKAHFFAVYDIAFHPTLPYFATCSRDKNIKIWSYPELKLRKNISFEKGFDAHRLSVNKLAWSTFNESLLSTGDDKLIKVWDITF